MLKGRLKQKAKQKAKSKAKQRVRGAVGRRGRDHKLLKTAAVGGTAYYAGKKISERGQEDQVPALQDESYASPPAADSGSDTVAQLQQLAQLHESGVLTDEEFASAKQKVLAGDQPGSKTGIFFLSYIPVIGFWLAAIPPTIFAFLEYGLPTAVIVFLGIVLINAFFDGIVIPQFYGEGLDKAPVMVILSLAVWTTVLGPLSAILSVPVTMIFKEMILEADEQNAWLARLMSKGDQEQLSEQSEPEQMVLA